MTLGEQIQSLRKTAGLSQEELGDKLGVARQSVSKWESDTTVPELDKLIAMSRLFGVSMGALLNLEEPEDTTEELTQRELTAVEEIAKRLAPPAQPAPPKRRGSRMAAGAAAAAVVIAGLLFVGRISRMQTQLDQLQGRVAGINSDISGQISSLAGQVRSSLEEQDQPLARSDYQIREMDRDLSAFRHPQGIPRGDDGGVFRRRDGVQDRISPGGGGGRTYLFRPADLPFEGRYFPLGGV